MTRPPSEQEPGQADRSALPSRWSKRAAALLLLLWIAFSAFYYLFPPTEGPKDSKYQLLVSHELFQRGSLALDAYAPPPFGSPRARPVALELPYQLIAVGDHVYHVTPLGTAVLMAPIVGVLDALGYSVVDERGRYRQAVETTIQRTVASLSMGALVVVFFLLAATQLDRRLSLAVAAAAGLTTPIWTVASAMLWSHTICVLLLGLALLHLLRRELAGLASSSLYLGTLLAWMFFVRPVSATSIAGIVLFVLWRWRARGAPLVVVGSIWLALFLLLSQSVYGTYLPPYYQPNRLGPWPIPVALLGNLISPARGVFVYMPVTLLGIALAVRLRSSIRCPGLVVAALGVTVANLWIVSSYHHWWGGHSWGPRFMTDVIPWWVLCTVLITAAARRAFTATGPPIWARWQVTAALASVGLALNVVAVACDSCNRWNLDVDVDRHPERLWDWKDPPFLRWISKSESANEPVCERQGGGPQRPGNTS